MWASEVNFSPLGPSEHQAAVVLLSWVTAEGRERRVLGAASAGSGGGCAVTHGHPLPFLCLKTQKEV